MELATLARAANTAGAKLLLVGDDAQLSAADTGGAFRLIAKDTQAAELTDVWRFTNPWERDASLALRDGDTRRHRRVRRPQPTHRRLIRGDGRRRLQGLARRHPNRPNQPAHRRRQHHRRPPQRPRPPRPHHHRRSRTRRHRTPQRQPRRPRRPHRHPPQQPPPPLRQPTTTSRTATTGPSSTAGPTAPSPSKTTTGDTVTLPSAYVQESVELAYATTAHRAQGATVDTAHLTRHRPAHPSPDVRRHDPRPPHQHRLRRHPPDHAQTSTNPTPNRPCKTSSKPSSTTPASNNPPTKSCAKNSTTPPASTASSPSTNTSANSTPRSATSPPSPPPASTQPTKPPSKPPPPTAPSSPNSAAPRTPASTSPTLLHRAVNQSPLTNANDLAAVLHHRVATPRPPRSLHNTGRHPAQIVGLVTPATHVSDPTLIAPLRELESQIIERANWLADQLLANPPGWYRELRHAAGEPPDQELTEARPRDRRLQGALPDPEQLDPRRRATSERSRATPSALPAHEDAHRLLVRGCRTIDRRHRDLSSVRVLKQKCRRER